MNTLILSKIWCCLRLAPVSQSFFSQLQSVVYQFVWRNCRHSIQYAIVCQPIKKGGLGLLDLQIQHLVLQVRWINNIVDCNAALCTTAYLRSHLSLITGSADLWALPLFCLSLRSGPYAQPFSVLHPMLKAFDRLSNVDVQSIFMPAVSILHLSLLVAFKEFPSDHWMLAHRHCHHRVADFFTFDASCKCFRPLLPIDHPRYPSFVSPFGTRHFTRKIHITPRFWKHIINTSSSDIDVDLSPLLNSFTVSHQWQRSRSKRFRCLLISQRFSAWSGVPFQPRNGSGFGN